MKAARFINAASEQEIIFTRGTTAAINLVASGYAKAICKEEDEIVITLMEHHSNLIPWQQAAKTTGRSIVLSFKRAFHGRTLMTMSLTSKVNPYKLGFGPFAPDKYKMPYPYYYRAPYNMVPEEVDLEILHYFEQFFLTEVSPYDVAAIILEPAKEVTTQLVTQCWKNGLLALSAGIYGNVIRFLPPLLTTDEQLDEGLQILDNSFAKIVR